MGIERGVQGGDALPFFSALDLWEDSMPRGAALQMAVDEALLAGGFLALPLLRHYRWKGRAASFGVSQAARDAAAAAPGFELVRRWTGGGIVLHDNDWTFSLLVPHGEPFARLRPRPAYRAIHTAVAAALGVVPALASTGPCRNPTACFQGPSADDLLGPGGSKICGGAQRRTKHGLLHQGSIQGIPVPDAFARSLASTLAETVRQFTPTSPIEESAASLAARRYANPAWLNRIA
jgi:lipoyl(octanoyl) transferase